MLDSIKIGHVTDKEKQTGTSVFLFDEMVTCAKYVAGSAPATRDVELLTPDSFVSSINAISLSGGSAFGLAAADGVMQWLKKHNKGFATAHGVVPIVPAAALYDFSAQSNFAPDATMGYQACENAILHNFNSGRIGAGTAATVGKLFPKLQSSASGFGMKTFQNAQGLEILACAAVNAVGEVIDKNGQIIAGARDNNNNIISMTDLILSGESIQTDLQSNTTLVVIVTNATFNKSELTRIAKVASTGISKAISPCFTLFDGDIIFAAATGECKADETQVSVIASEMLREAIINAVQ